MYESRYVREEVIGYMIDAWELAADDSVISETDMATWHNEGPDETGDAEYAAWLRGLPDDIGADDLSRPSARPLESEPAGFSHHDATSASGGVGFSAGGALDSMAPGPDLAWFAAATDADRAELDESALIGVLCAWQRLTSWAQAGQTATLMTLARRREAQAREQDRPSLAEHVSDEVAAALGLTGRSANQILFTAGGLDRLPDVHALLSRGEIDWARACLFVDQLSVLSSDDAREIAAPLIGRAGGMTSGQLRAALAQAVLAHDPQAAERRRKAARADSGVHTWTETSGNAALAGRELATTDVIHASVRLTAFARWLRKHGATGTMDQLRAAVYIALLTGRSVQSLLPHHHDPADPVTRPEPGTPDQTAAAPANAASANADPANAGPANAVPGNSPPADPGPANSRAAIPGPAGASPASTTAPTAATSAAWPPVNGTLSAAALAGAAGAGWPQLTGTINLTMPMSTWLGITRNPGEVANLGPVDAEACHDLAASMDPASQWCLTVTDTAGRAVAHACAHAGPPPPMAPPPPQPQPTTSPPPTTGPPVCDSPGHAGSLAWVAGLAVRLQYFETAPCSHARESASYKPSRSLRHLIEIRQRRCAYVGCRRAAVRCDLDHTVPYDKGGRTCECDLAPVCRRHHRAKQAPGWHLDQHKPGEMTWRLPSGRVYQTTGDPY
jgi:hypothetical protein